MVYSLAMSRPLRIEYPGAYYHVMNRGAGRKAIYVHDDHRIIFLELLRELDTIYQVETHAYCLMGNHYHLLLRTPQGNLSRAMRHLNGVYTQRYNRTRKSDGPLYRGRYKAVLIDADSYLLNVSRYIHRNPVEAGMTKKAQDYQWSSYRAYIGQTNPPQWLNIEATLNMIGQRNRQKQYRAFVEAGIDQETLDFYQKKKLNPIFGKGSFINKQRKAVTRHKEQPESQWTFQSITPDEIVASVAQGFRVNRETILQSVRGRGQENLARSASIYVTRKMTAMPLTDIADYYGMNHYGSVSGSNSRFETRMKQDKRIANAVERVIKNINT